MKTRILLMFVAVAASAQTTLKPDQVKFAVQICKAVSPNPIIDGMNNARSRAYTCPLSPVNWEPGQVVIMLPDLTCLDSPTLAINSTGPVPILTWTGSLDPAIYGDIRGSSPTHGPIPALLVWMRDYWLLIRHVLQRPA